MIAPLAGDEPGAGAGAGELVVGERDLERGVDRFGAGIAEEHALEGVGGKLGQARGQVKRRSVPGLERGRVVEPAGLAADGLDDRLAAMTGVAAPQPRHGIEHLAPVGGEVMHAGGAIDQPGTPLEGAIGGEREPIGGKLGLVERGV